MRNQIRMAKRIGIHMETINSTNRDVWKRVESSLLTNKCDLLMSPELRNPQLESSPFTGNNPIYSIIHENVGAI